MGKGYQYAQMYHYHYPPPHYAPPYYGEPKYQPQYPPKNPPPYYGEPKYQPQYPPKNPPPYYPKDPYPPPTYKGKGKGAVFGMPKHMKVRKMAKGGYGNFFPRIPGQPPDKGKGIPFGIWPRFPAPAEPMTPAPVPIPFTPPPVPPPPPPTGAPVAAPPATDTPVAALLERETRFNQ